MKTKGPAPLPPACRRSARRHVVLVSALLAVIPAEAALAKTGDEARAETVLWTASVKPEAARPASLLTLTLEARVREGWHVYALKQLPGGPTPLRVTLDANSLATANGEAAGSPPTTIHDPSFDLDTRFYSHAFTVTVPVRIGAKPAADRQLIPVSVRFQTCNDRVCQPPKTVRLSAAVTVLPR